MGRPRRRRTAQRVAAPAAHIVSSSGNSQSCNRPQLMAIAKRATSPAVNAAPGQLEGDSGPWLSTTA